jgi:proteasome alpha subunit
MSYNFYDFNNALKQRDDYVEDRLRDGSPVIGVSFDDGLLLLSVRGTQRKIYEVYDRQVMGALGKQSDIESIRLAAIETTHREGFARSEDDVSLQRLIGFGLSPAIKRIYNDNNVIPLTLRVLFAEVNKSPETDAFFVLGYDGEYRELHQAAAAAGSAYAEEQAIASLKEAAPKTLAEAVAAAIVAWGIAKLKLAPPVEKLDDDGTDDEATAVPTKTGADLLKEALAGESQIEAAILDRSSNRQSRFRLLRLDEIAPHLG